MKKQNITPQQAGENEEHQQMYLLLDEKHRQEMMDIEQQTQAFNEKALQLGTTEQMEDNPGCIGNCYKCCLTSCGCCIKILCCLCSMFNCGPIKIINQGNHGILKQFGKFKLIQGPGMYIYNYCTEEYIDIDTRVMSQDVSAQSIMTNDFVNIKIDAIVYWKIIDPKKAIFKVQQLKQAIACVTLGTIKKVIAKFELQAVLSQRKVIDQALKDLIDKKTEFWGVQIISIETKFIQLPQSMQRALAIVAESQKEKESKLIQAKGNLEAATVMRQAADEMSKNPVTIQLHYFEIMKMIAKDNSEAIIVPDIFLNMLKGTGMAKAQNP